jgi:hypothetical protein
MTLDDAVNYLFAVLDVLILGWAAATEKPWVARERGAAHQAPRP